MGSNLLRKDMKLNNFEEYNVYVNELIKGHAAERLAYYYEKRYKWAIKILELIIWHDMTKKLPKKLVKQHRLGINLVIRKKDNEK